jgi:hypothetical protein
MTDVLYHHDRNPHTLNGAVRCLGYLLEGRNIKSLLDVGAGTGNWLFAARQTGIDDLLGIDGVPSHDRKTWVESDLIKFADLRIPLKIGRRFDAVLCLEVAEHLPMQSARTLVESLCTHSDLIFFSAAAPGQLGESHLNCQWPIYWQEVFGSFGFVCRDEIRLRIWDEEEIEPWYKQNIFVAFNDPAGAGREPRIRSMIHPDMIECMEFPQSLAAKYLVSLEQGAVRPLHYLRLLGRSLMQRWGKSRDEGSPCP